MKPAFRNFQNEQRACTAIKKKREIKFRYEDDLRERTVQPYILFEEPNTKSIILAGYMTDNPNHPIITPEWRRFDFYLVQYFSITDTVFNPDPQFSSLKDIYGNDVVCAIDHL